ncbi:MAG TPA: hypothetical protein VFC67_02915 [Prolixibacteraceae bacterium]|nr:hypothetical protein [Prolixibacteraceae bacterium]
MGYYKKSQIGSIGELISYKGGRNLTPIFNGSQLPVLVYVTKSEFEKVRFNKELMKELAVKKLNENN